MNLKTFRLTISSSLLLVTIEICSSKKFEVIDMNPISDRFADLLETLVKVNTEREDALRKILKLYDVSEANQLLRTTQDENDDSELDEFIVFDKNDEYSDKMDEPINWIHDNKQLCSCQNIDPLSAEIFYEDLKKQALSREYPFNVMNLRFLDKPSTEADLVIFLSVDKSDSLFVDSKQLSNERNHFVSSESTLSREVVISNPLKLVNRSHKLCISPSYGYEDCKTACKDAYRLACDEYGCKEKLYKQFKKECRYACKERFIDRFDDYSD